MLHDTSIYCYQLKDVFHKLYFLSKIYSTIGFRSKQFNVLQTYDTPKSPLFARIYQFFLAVGRPLIRSQIFIFCFTLFQNSTTQPLGPYLA
jgi:hypothetical protein